jgi:cystathionine beta-lyase
MTHFDFDTVIPRRATHSAKWSFFDEDVLPMWVADMDFVSPPAVLEQVHERVNHGIFGYTLDYPELRETIANRMQRLYQWQIQPEDMVFVPGMVTALNLFARTYGKNGDGILMQTPVYGPFLTVPPNNGRFAVMADLRSVPTGDCTFTYEIDFDIFEKAITKQTSAFFLCNPHNPGGRAFTETELRQMADICLKHNLLICADEIHCDLLLNGTKHIPIASLSPEIAQNTVTLIAPSKTYNLPGLGCSIAIIQNKELRHQFEMANRNMGLHVNILGLVGATAAYQHGDEWLAALLDYLSENRDIVVAFIQDHLPMLKITVPEATYLAWLDCSALSLPENMGASEYFVKEGRLALNPGTFFGTGYDQFVRLNFGCPRSLLLDGLERLKTAVEKLNVAVAAGQM